MELILASLPSSPLLLQRPASALKDVLDLTGGAANVDLDQQRTMLMTRVLDPFTTPEYTIDGTRYFNRAQTAIARAWPYVRVAAAAAATAAAPVDWWDYALELCASMEEVLAVQATVLQHWPATAGGGAGAGGTRFVAIVFECMAPVTHLASALAVTERVALAAVLLVQTPPAAAAAAAAAAVPVEAVQLVHDARNVPTSTGVIVWRPFAGTLQALTHFVWLTAAAGYAHLDCRKACVLEKKTKS